MLFRHKHYWITVACQYFPPTHKVATGDLGINLTYTQKKLVYGFTLVTDECIYCGKTQQDEMFSEVKLDTLEQYKVDIPK